MKKSVLLFLIICFPVLIYAQIERSKLFGAYVYNLARYTVWPNEQEQVDFQIILIGSNNAIIDELRTVTQQKEIKGKKVSFKFEHNLPNEIRDNTRILILLEESSSMLNDALKLIGNRSILLLTEKNNDKKRIRYNIFDTSTGGLSFEINRANILSHGFTVDPEIILLGGTEIDVADLYRASQKMTDALQQRMDLMNDSLLALKSEISKTHSVVEEQMNNILSQNKLIEANNRKIESYKLEIETRKSEVIKQRELLDQQKSLFESQNAKIAEHKIELDEQRTFIEIQLGEIQQSKHTLDSLNSEIANQNQELGKQDVTIEKQRLIIALAIATGLLAFIILISLINSYLNKNKKNKILIQQKEQIEKINKKLERTNRSLFDTITKLHETQSQLVSSEKMASLGVLTAGIAHEINNPVNFIYTGINSLNKDVVELTTLLTEILQQINARGGDELIGSINEIKKDGELDEILEIIPQTIEDIKVGAERAAEIIKGLRNFSRLDKDSMQISNIHEGLDSALLLLRNKFKNHIAVKKEYSQLPEIECYPGKLNQAFINVLSNAIDAIEKEGTITIRTWANEEKIYIQIQDSGKGIPTDVIDKIYDPFFTTKSVGKGVGLGLSITYGIIQEHNGKIDVKSVQNSGTTFTISLPCIS